MCTFQPGEQRSPCRAMINDPQYCKCSPHANCTVELHLWTQLRATIYKHLYPPKAKQKAKQTKQENSEGGHLILGWISSITTLFTFLYYKDVFSMRNFVLKYPFRTSLYPFLLSSPRCLCTRLYTYFIDPNISNIFCNIITESLSQKKSWTASIIVSSLWIFFSS